MPENIKVVVAVDDCLFREGLSIALQKEDELEVVGEASDCTQVIDIILETKADVALLDCNSSKDLVLKTIPKIREKHPGIKVLVHTKTWDEAFVFEALRAGAKGFLLRDENIRDLIRAIQAVHRGELWMERQLLAKYFDGEQQNGSKTKYKSNGSKDLLTIREKEVLCILSTGCSNKEIAKKLFISEKTVKCHLNNIFKKLKFSQRLQAILFAIKHGMK